VLAGTVAPQRAVCAVHLCGKTRVPALRIMDRVSGLVPIGRGPGVRALIGQCPGIVDRVSGLVLIGRGPGVRAPIG